MNKQFYYIPLPLEGLLFETLMAGEILLPSQHFHQLKIGFLGENTYFPFGIPNAISLFTTLGNDLAKNSTDGGHLFVLQVDAGVLVESCLQEIGNGKAYSYHAPILLRPNTCNILFYTQSDLLFIKSQAVSFSQVKCLQKYEHCFRLIDDAVQLPEFEIMLAPKKIAKGSQKNGQPVAKKAKEEVENRLAGAAIHRLNHLKGALLGLVVAVTKIGTVWMTNWLAVGGAVEFSNRVTAKMTVAVIRTLSTIKVISERRRMMSLFLNPRPQFPSQFD